MPFFRFLFGAPCVAAMIFGLGLTAQPIKTLGPIWGGVRYDLYSGVGVVALAAFALAMVGMLTDYKDEGVPSLVAVMFAITGALMMAVALFGVGDHYLTYRYGWIVTLLAGIVMVVAGFVLKLLMKAAFRNNPRSMAL